MRNLMAFEDYLFIINTTAECLKNSLSQSLRRLQNNWKKRLNRDYRNKELDNRNARKLNNRQN